MNAPSDNPAADNRSRLIQAGREAFCEAGYRASVDLIAARAGVAKQTLYNHFPSKADLFAAVIGQATAEFLVALGEDGEGLRARLVRFGVRYREKLLTPAGLGLYRMLIAEMPRFPELAAAFYKSGPARTTEKLDHILREAMERGELCREDPRFAATQLLSMLVGAERSHCLFSGDCAPQPDPAEAERIVDCFLRAFAPEAAPATRREK